MIFTRKHGMENFIIYRDVFESIFFCISIAVHL
jgi:hypothetical protein